VDDVTFLIEQVYEAWKVDCDKALSGISSSFDRFSINQKAISDHWERISHAVPTLMSGAQKTDPISMLSHESRARTALRRRVTAAHTTELVFNLQNPGIVAFLESAISADAFKDVHLTLQGTPQLLAGGWTSNPALHADHMRVSLILADISLPSQTAIDIGIACAATFADDGKSFRMTPFGEPEVRATASRPEGPIIRAVLEHYLDFAHDISLPTLSMGAGIPAKSFFASEIMAGPHLFAGSGVRPSGVATISEDVSEANQVYIKFHKDEVAREFQSIIQTLQIGGGISVQLADARLFASTDRIDLLIRASMDVSQDLAVGTSYARVVAMASTSIAISCTTNTLSFVGNGIATIQSARVENARVQVAGGTLGVPDDIMDGFQNLASALGVRLQGQISAGPIQQEVSCTGIELTAVRLRASDMILVCVKTLSFDSQDSMNCVQS
jgi:hypothetical protein